jgi:mono/diheme cytochrome c family protein
MRVRFMVLSIVCVMLLAFAIGCAKQEPPQPVAPAAPAAPAAPTAPAAATPAAPAAPAAATPAAPAAPAADGKSIFEAKCSVCHGIDRATSRTETKEKWASLVKEMQGKKADWISDVEAAKIVEFLAAEHGKK